ncbi:MAG: rhomboid family intramembrane serine protease [Bacteroidetes bacterium]|nr:rhomboid family intramembrane serine protease [Bacteroidota bacterium]
MKNLTIKLKEVYLPYLLVSVGSILFYYLFRWLFDIKLGVLPLKDELLNLFIPMAVPWIPVLIWLRKRINILRISDKHFGYLFIMAWSIAIPIIVSQSYLEKASFDLITVNKVSEINNHPDEKYFVINSFRINSTNVPAYTTNRTTGRNNDKLNFYLYLACPFENSKNVWYGIKYRDYISNRQSDKRKNSEFQDFMADAEKEFKKYDFQKVTYFERLHHNDDRDGYIEAIRKQNPNVIKSEQTILIPQTTIFSKRMGNTFMWILGTFGIGQFVLLLMITIPKIDESILSDFKNKKPHKDEELRFFLQSIDIRGHNQVIAVLLLLNTAVFLAMTISGINIISPTPQELLEIGGIRRQEVMNGEYWRLITSFFIHAGLMHLLMNMAGLWMSGLFLKNILNRGKLLLSYFFSGILSGITSIYWHENMVAVGASGAIFGLFGLMLAFSVFKVYPKETRRFALAILGFLGGGSLLYGLFGGIDNAAHIGGLFSGFVLGVVFILMDKKGVKERTQTTVL